MAGSPSAGSRSPLRVRSSPRIASGPRRQYASPKRERPTGGTPNRAAAQPKKVVAPQPRVRSDARSTASSTNDFWKSMRIYIGCLITLGAMWFYVLSHAPPPPAIEECDNFGFYAVITVGKDPTALSRMITCAQAYQRYNWWFVVCTFFLTYIGIKMFAIPAVFPLGILGGAIFPFWLSLFLTASGEALGNSLCYLMSASIAQPVLERLFPQKLAKVAQKAEEEKDNWLLFNFFLRLTPFVPNWFVNLSSPIVGNPIKPFIIGSFFGTQFSLFFLALCGNTLAKAGEQAYADIRSPLALLSNPRQYAHILIVGGLGVASQAVPVYLIRMRKQAKAEATGKRG